MMIHGQPLGFCPSRFDVGGQILFFQPTMTAGQRHDRSALILYGSETGTAHDVAEEMSIITERLHFLTHVLTLDAVEPVSGTEML